MPSPIVRWAALALVATLLFVPSLTRAGQQIDAGRGVNLGAGFSKAGNRPPDPVRVAPDQDVIRAGLLELTTRAVAVPVPFFDELLPPSPLQIDLDSLRAPPASL